MVSLVTGASGFIGSHLVDYLSDRDHAVVEVSRGGKRPIDLLDKAAVQDALSAARPDWIFHLAAQSLPGVSWEDPDGTFRANVDGTVNLLEAVRAAKLNPILVVAGSSSIYRPRTDGAPLREDAPAGPSSPYAVSKLAEEHIARVYGSKYAMRVIVVRPFFLIGPRKKGDVCSDLARGIVAIERGTAGTLSIGNTKVVRDFLDVRDGVEALALVAEKGKAGESYNICSGRGLAISDILARFETLAKKPLVRKEDPARMRPIDEMVKVGDPTKLRDLGWKPERDIDATLAEILEYWRKEPA